MKIKGNRPVKIRTLGLLALICAVVLIALRFVQVIFFVDPETGFFSKSSPLNIVFYVVVALAFVAFVALSFVSEKVDGLNPVGYRSKLSIFALFVFLSFGFDAVGSLLSLGGGDPAQTTYKILLFAGVLRAVFAVFSLIYFVFVFLDESKGGTKSNEKKILALAPACWAAVRLIALFTTKISYVRVSDLLLQIMYLALFALFFVNFAQIRCGVYSEGNAWKVYAYGTPGALIALAVMIVRLALVFSGKWTIYKGDYPFILADAMVALYILTFLYTGKSYVRYARARLSDEDGASDEADVSTDDGAASGEENDLNED